MAKQPKIRPLGDKVIVQRSEANAMTEGGIVLPDSAKEKPKKGTVMAVGTGKLLDSGKRASMQVNVGDKVLFTPYGGTEVDVDKDTLIIMDENDILGVITG